MHISYPLPSLSLFLALCNFCAWVIRISYTYFHELVSDAFACARRTIVLRFLCISHNHFRDLSLFHVVQMGRLQLLDIHWLYTLSLPLMFLLFVYIVQSL